MKKTPTTTDAHCLGCDWTAGPGLDAAIDRAAEKHTCKGHPTATITAPAARAVIAGLAFSVIVAAIVLIAAGAWTGVPQ